MTEPSLIEQAIIDHWGERCPEYEPGCHACEAWKEYDAMTQQNQSPVVTDGPVRAAAEFLTAIARASNLSKALCEEADAHASALEAALPSGVRWTDDLADKLCQAITHSGALMYQEEIVAVQDVIRKTLSAIEPTQASEGEIERHQLFVDFVVEYDDDHYVIRWLNDDWAMDSLSVFHGGSIVAVRTGADGEQLSRKFHFDDAIQAASSHAETVAPYASALRMIRDAVGELFGHVSDLESEEAVLLRGPEPHHEAEAIIAGLQRVTGEAERLLTLNADLEMQARGHAQEARTANATIYEIYQVLSGGKGEPGNWNGAEPARQYVHAAEARVAELLEEVRQLREGQ